MVSKWPCCGGSFMWSYLHLDSLLRRPRRSRHLFAHRFDDALVHVRRISPPQQLPGPKRICHVLGCPLMRSLTRSKPLHLDGLLMPASTVSFKIWCIGTSTVFCRVRFVWAQTTTEISSRFAKRLLTRRTLPDVCLAIINFGGSETTGRHRC